MASEFPIWSTILSQRQYVSLCLAWFTEPWQDNERLHLICSSLSFTLALLLSMPQAKGVHLALALWCVTASPPYSIYHVCSAFPKILHTYGWFIDFSAGSWYLWNVKVLPWLNYSNNFNCYPSFVSKSYTKYTNPASRHSWLLQAKVVGPSYEANEPSKEWLFCTPMSHACRNSFNVWRWRPRTRRRRTKTCTNPKRLPLREGPKYTCKLNVEQYRLSHNQSTRSCSIME